MLRTAKVGGVGGFDYLFADTDGRRLYIPRGGTPGTPPGPGRVAVFNLDTLAPVGEIPNASARGAAVDPKSGHGFASGKPIVMWNTKTLASMKTIGNSSGTAPQLLRRCWFWADREFKAVAKLLILRHRSWGASHLRTPRDRMDA